MTARTQLLNGTRFKGEAGNAFDTPATLGTNREFAPAKLNLALHVRGKLPDGRHEIETLFAFCTDGDRLTAERSDRWSLRLAGPFADGLGDEKNNLVIRAGRALAARAGISSHARFTLDKQLPVASGIGGGSADAAAALRLLTSMWRLDPAFAEEVAPELGSDVPACLLSLPARGSGAGDALSPVSLNALSGTPVLLVNPKVRLFTADVFARWDGLDRGPLDDWHSGRNDLERSAVELVPQIAEVLEWLRKCTGAIFVRMSGSGATCFALFEDDSARDRAANQVPTQWWCLPTYLR